MKFSIKAELAYSFAQATQIIANLQASETDDQTILSESLNIQPPAQILSDKTSYGDRRMRASLVNRRSNLGSDAILVQLLFRAD